LQFVKFGYFSVSCLSQADIIYAIDSICISWCVTFFIVYLIFVVLYFAYDFIINNNNNTRKCDSEYTKQWDLQNNNYVQHAWLMKMKTCWTYSLLPTVLPEMIRQSVTTSVRLFSLCFLNGLTFELLVFIYVWVMSIARLGLKVKVIDQG